MEPHIEITKISFFQIFWEKKLYKLPISPLSATQIATLIASVGPIERYKPQSFGNKNCDEIDPFIQGAAPMKKYLRQSSNSPFLERIVYCSQFVTMLSPFTVRLSCMMM